MNGRIIQPYFLESNDTDDTNWSLEPDDTNLFHKHSGLFNIKYETFHQLSLLKFIWEFIPDNIYQGIDSRQYLMLPENSFQTVLNVIR